MCVMPILAVIVDFLLCEGTPTEPAAIFPLKPGETPMAFAWTEEGLSVDEDIVPWEELKIEPHNGSKFVWRTYCSDGEEAVLRGTLKSSASKFKVSDFSGVCHRNASGVVRLVAQKSGIAKVNLVCRGPRSPILRQLKQTKLNAGVEGHIDLFGETTTIAKLGLTVYDVDGSRLFNPRDWAVVDRDFIFALRCLKMDREKMILHVLSDNWFGTDNDHALRVEMVDFDSGEVVWQTKVPALPRRGGGYAADDGMSDQPIDVKGLKPGQYKCMVTLIDEDGKEVANDYLYYAKPDGNAIWEGTTYGAEDTVPPPWTAPEFRNGGFTCWNRSVAFGGNGLVTSIVSGGREFLDGPIFLEVDGRKVEFRSKLVRRGVSEADYVLTSRKVPIMVKLRCEFDGYMRFDVTWAPPVKKMELKLPIRRSEIVGFDDCSSVKHKYAIGKGESRIIEYSPQAKPWWWIGSTIGLMGGIGDLGGWRLKDTEKGYRLEVTNDKALFTIKFVDTPIKIGKKRTISFYLQPTPVKPKNREIGTMPLSNINYWTGHVERFYEDKWPGRISAEAISPFVEQVKNGKRVFYYNASQGVSPMFPWWGWYGDEWNIYNNPGVYSEEVPYRKGIRPYEAWVNGYLNVRSFLDYKIWSVCWYLWNPDFGIKDLYWDLAGPLMACPSERHGCAFSDEFGQERCRSTVFQLRELHKRVYRELKKKNPDGAMMGHITKARTPADAFFDAVVMGERYDADMVYTLSYFDILTPGTMQVAYASRSSEITVIMLPQFHRAMQMYAPERLKGYDPNSERNSRAIRHAAAYFRIHDLGIGGDRVAAQITAPEKILAEEFGRDRRHSAYYMPDCPVTVSKPDDRFIYAIFEGNGKKMLILLNDTDHEIVETVSVQGLSATGEDIYGNGSFDFTSGSCDLILPPRESRFIVFRR